MRLRPIVLNNLPSMQCRTLWGEQAIHSFTSIKGFYSEVSDHSTQVEVGQILELVNESLLIVVL